jgi:hypothetical protein
MPANALNVIDVIRHVDAVGSYNLTTQDKGVLVTNLPVTTGTTVFLPLKAQSGDRYQVTTDASCGPTHPLIVRSVPLTAIVGPPFIGGSTFGFITTSFFRPEVSLEFFFEEETQSWWIDSESGAPHAPDVIAETFTPIPATLVLTGALQVVVSKAVVLPGSEQGEFFAASFPIVNSGGAVVAGHVNAQVFVDGVGLGAYSMTFAFGTEGLTTVTMTGKTTMGVGPHTIDIRCSATAAGLEVVAGAGGLFLEQFGV